MLRSDEGSLSYPKSSSKVRPSSSSSSLNAVELLLSENGGRHFFLFVVGCDAFVNGSFLESVYVPADKVRFKMFFVDSGINDPVPGDRPVGTTPCFGTELREVVGDCG